MVVRQGLHAWDRFQHSGATLALDGVTGLTVHPRQTRRYSDYIDTCVILDDELEEGLEARRIEAFWAVSAAFARHVHRETPYLETTRKGSFRKRGGNRTGCGLSPRASSRPTGDGTVEAAASVPPGSARARRMGGAGPGAPAATDDGKPRKRRGVGIEVPQPVPGGGIVPGRDAWPEGQLPVHHGAVGRRLGRPPFTPNARVTLRMDRGRSERDA